MMYEIVGLAAAYMVIEFAKMAINTMVGRGLKEQMAVLEKQLNHQMEMIVRIQESQSRVEPALQDLVRGLNKAVHKLERICDILKDS